MLFLSALFGLFSCRESASKESKEKDVKEEYYGWSPSANAPKEYPIEVIRGCFYKGKELAFVPNGSVLNGGWGMDGMQMRGAFFIPEGLKITFLSFVENKFYRADVKLPSDLILHYFREGYIDYDSKKKETYSNIYIGIAPGGVLVLWMAGSGNQQVEIGRYQAVETEVEMEEVNPSGERDREVYVKGTIEDRKEVVENLKENGIQFGLHDTYRTKYTWRPKVILPEGSKMEWMAVLMFNGEAEEVFGEKQEKNEYVQRAIPKKIYLRWLNDNGEKFGGEIHFDWNEPETFKAFEQIYQKNKEAQAELVMKVFQLKKLDAFKVYLRTEKEEFELEDTDNGLYKMTR